MVERQLRRRGIEDERVLAAMAEVPRERFVPETSAAAYRDGALPIGEGQTISQPWIVARMTAAAGAGGPRAGARGGHRLGLRGGGAVALLPHVVDHRAPRGLAEAAARDPERARLRQRRGARGRRLARRARPRALRRRSRSPPRPPTSPPRALFDQLAPGAALVCPVDAAARELLMRFRDGAEEAFAAGALRAAGEGEE